MEEASNNNADVFIYMGEGGPVVPHDIVRVRVHPSVTVIHPSAFEERRQLEEVELCDGLLEIGGRAFSECTSLKRITIPSTVITIRFEAFFFCAALEEVQLREGLQTIGTMCFYDCRSMKNIIIPTTVQMIGFSAFCHVPLHTLILPEGIESIGVDSFSHGRFSTVRLPPNITSMNMSVFNFCGSMFSLELPENITDNEVPLQVGTYDIYNRTCLTCSISLRNLAVPHDVAFLPPDVFSDCTDLEQLFGSVTNIINALKHRFDNLPIHKMYTINHIIMLQSINLMKRQVSGLVNGEVS